MTTKAQQAVAKDIAERLSKIAFHFEERNRIRFELEQYTGDDLSKDSPRWKEMERILTRIQSEELSTLYELAHLVDNVRKHFKLHQLDVTKLKVIEKSKLHRVAVNFVNVHKHGSRGRNRPAAQIDYTAPIFVQKGKKPESSDTLIDIVSLINFEGSLFDSMDLIKSLIRMWEMFLRNHTELDIKTFVSRIGTVLALERGKSTYSAKIPSGVLTDAKAQAEQRKHIDL